MKIQIGPYEFPLADRYKNGSVVNEAEAKALNVERGERLRAVISRKIARLAPEGQVLTGELREQLYDFVASQDASFEFESRDRTKPKVGTLEQEIREVAAEEAQVQARQRGQENNAGLIAELFDALLLDARVETLAAQRIEARKAVALEGLGEL